MLTTLQPYWYEFMIIAAAHLLAVASPGPDFAVVSKHAVAYGRRCALYTSLGVGCAIMLHITYTLIGIGLLLSQTPWLFDVFKYAAAAYLCYIGYLALRSQPSNETASESDLTQPLAIKTMNDKKSFWLGFLTNGLNPKATLFFLSLFTVIVSAQTPMVVKVVYGVYMSFATALWFSSLSLVLTLPKVRQFLLRKGYLFDRLMGLILILLAIKLVFSQI